MEIMAFQATPFYVNCYVLKEAGEALVIDPGEITPGIVRALAGCRVRAIVNTHGHGDHCGGNAELRQKTGAPLAAHKDDLPLLRSLTLQGQMFGLSIPASPDPDRYLVEGDTLELGQSVLRVLHVPGHTPGHIALLCGNNLFCGDVLFAGSIGRTDLPGGDSSQLLESIRTKLLVLPDDTIVYSGHGPASSIGEERRDNPFLVGL